MNGRTSPPNVYLRYCYFVPYPPLPSDDAWSPKLLGGFGETANLFDSLDDQPLEVPNFDFEYEKKVIESAEADRVRNELLLREHCDYLRAKAEHRRVFSQKLLEQKRIEDEKRQQQQQEQHRQQQLQREQEEQLRIQKEQQQQQEQELKRIEQEKEKEQQQILMQQQFEQLQIQQQQQQQQLPPPPSYSPQSQPIPSTISPQPTATISNEKKAEVKRDKESMKHLREHLLATQKLFNPPVPSPSHPTTSPMLSSASALPQPPLYPAFNGGVPIMNGYHPMPTPMQPPPPPYNNGHHQPSNGVNLTNGMYPSIMSLPQPTPPIAPQNQQPQNFAWEVGCQLFGENNIDKVAEFTRFCQKLGACGFKLGREPLRNTLMKVGRQSKDQQQAILNEWEALDRSRRQSNGPPSYPLTESDVEDALIAFDGDMREAAKYLSGQFLLNGMGFSPIKAKEALLLSNNNTDKAITYLLST